MQLYIYQLQQGMTPEQQLLFRTELARREKSPAAAFLLCLFLGCIGAHEYYLGEIGAGIVYTLFSWTLVPAVIAFFQLFTIWRRTEDLNLRQAAALAAAIRAGLPPHTGTKLVYCSRCGAAMRTVDAACARCGAPVPSAA